MKPKFKTTDDGLVIIDRIERGRYSIKTNTPVLPESTDTNKIPAPMDTTVQIITDCLSIPSNTVYVRDTKGVLIKEVQPNERVDLPQSEYILDISKSIKVYAYINSEVEIRITDEKTTIKLQNKRKIIVGARSYHTRPAATITTTSDPANVMQAVSMLGSALKTTGPERSYPTYRGHPPTITVGDELTIPDGLTRPNTEITIEVPQTLRHIFVIAPLAYYLSAKVRSGTTPQIVTDSGFSYPLENKGDLENTVKRVLKQIFLFDCVVRTEGLTPLQSHERQVLEPLLDFNLEETYEQTIADQIETYLDISFEKIAPYLPGWHLETYLEPTSDHIGFLPFAVTDLGIISVKTDTNQRLSTIPSLIKSETEIEAAAEGLHYNNDSIKDMNTNINQNSDSNIVTVPQSWSRETDTKIKSTTPLSAFHNGLEQTPRAGPLEIEVVCNDQAMSDELIAVYSTYGDHADLPFDITVHHDLTTSELEEVFTQESDFLHYIGHIDADGFRCSDGRLNAKTVESVGIKSFLLNACRSHDQGLYLIEAGSIGGIVTLSEITNSEAVRIGRIISYLLNRGYTLYAALDIVQMETDIATKYQLVGDGRQTIAQSEVDAQNVCSVTKNGDLLEVTIISYAGGKEKKGGLFKPYIDSVDEYYIVPQNIGSFSITKPQFIEFTNLEDMPVFLDGELYLRGEISIDELNR